MVREASHGDDLIRITDDPDKDLGLGVQVITAIRW